MGVLRILGPDGDTRVTWEATDADVGGGRPAALRRDRP